VHHFSIIWRYRTYVVDRTSLNAHCIKMQYYKTPNEKSQYDYTWWVASYFQG
jgi:hypothetical protein